MNRHYLIILIVISLSAVGCTSPLDRKYNPNTLESDAELIRDRIDSTEVELLTGTILRYSLENKPLEGKTYRELIEDGKRYRDEQERIQREQGALAEAAKFEEEERIRRLNEALTVSIFEKGYIERDYEDYIIYKFAFQNKSNKDIVGFTGLVTFSDLFDQEISSLTLSYDDGIKANSRVNWTATTDYNQFKKEDQALRSKDLSKIKLIWKPEQILFKDGTKLE